MAHFAELNSNNEVLRVIVVGNQDCLDADGQESDAVGIAFCHSLFGAGAQWVQTSYNGTIRGLYAGIGYTYDEQRDAFIPPQPYAGWVLNEDSCLWEAPVPMPEDGERYQWDEDAGDWVAI